MKRQGSIQKKGDIYYAVFAVGAKRKWIRGGKTKADAQRVLNENLYELDNGTYKSVPKQTFGEFAARWLKAHTAKQLKGSTAVYYGGVIERLASLNDRQMADITTGDLDDYLAKRLEIVSRNTARNDVTVIKLLFRAAKKQGYIKVNPAEDLDRPKREKSSIELLTPDEVGIFLNSCDRGLYCVAFLTAIRTGLRAGELWGLQWGDIDWRSKKIHVRRSVWAKTFQTPKSDHSIRTVDVPDSLLSELKAWKLACPISEHDLVFPTKKGGITKHDCAIKRHFLPALRRAGLRHVSFHSLRHTNASMRIQYGQSPKYISQQLGHSSIQITMDIYGHLFKDTDFARQQVDLLEAGFQAAVRKPLENASHVEDKGGSESPITLVVA
jgi:integrase